ncbi:MAG: hypothetical protein LBC43_01935 [Bifidobacteriaceae bacterium]|jgi:D-3-phosphoglycerate dehydrogenase|nr:hypothetical protein [Bifidobacteriaceae bacterium]
MSFQIKTFNNIAPAALANFSDQFDLEHDQKPAAVIVRSADLHDLEFNYDLRAIVRAGVGVDNIPVQRATEQGIVVFNTPGANANAVKDLVIAAMIMRARNIVPAVEWVKNLPVDAEPKFVEAHKKQFAGRELVGKTLGVVGLGAIGLKVASDALKLGMRVLGYDHYMTVEKAWGMDHRIEPVMMLSEIFSESDFVSLHTPANAETEDLIDQKTLKFFKPTGQLLNFARGSLVDTSALLKALDTGRLAGYTTDFYEPELAKRKDILIFPHLGASTIEAEVTAASIAVETIQQYLLTGQIQNSVNFPEVKAKLASPHRFLLIHRNVPGMINHISKLISDANVNISQMLNRSRDEYAVSLVDIDQTNQDMLSFLKDSFWKIDEILRVRLINNFDFKHASAVATSDSASTVGNSGITHNNT